MTMGDNGVQFDSGYNLQHYRANMIQQFAINTLGNDYIIGDLHGCYSKLLDALNSVCFDESTDRVFSVGDLIDRGTESARCANLLDNSWFHAVRGNHEQLVIDYMSGYKSADLLLVNGGAWFLTISRAEQQHYADLFSTMPYVIEVETAQEVIGIVHADCPVSDWIEFKELLTQDTPRANSARNTCLWDRSRIYASNGNGGDIGVDSISKVYVGHTPVSEEYVIGNVHYIDTGAVYGDMLTIVKL